MMSKNLRKLFITRKKLIAIILLFLFVIFFGRLIVEVIRWMPTLLQYFFQKEIALQKTEERVNVLFLGIGGGRHEGPLLTDTIIYASIDPEKEKVTLISIPRDLWIEDLRAKINTAYSYGEEKRKDGGIILTKTLVSKILNQPVDYVLRIDFNGFVRAIDMVGGIDVEVERSFEDQEYPISGKETDTCGFEGEEFEKRATSSAIFEAFPCRYEHISFQEGIQHMDGVTALKFVRSRHAKGVEGTDFARSKRQELVIQAFRNKAFSLTTLLNPAKVMSLYDVFQDSLHTDIKQSEYDDFVKLAKKMKDTKINNVVFFYTDAYSNDPGIFVNPPTSGEFGNQWVLIPRRGASDFSEIQQLVDCEIKIGNCNIIPIPTQ